MPTPNPPEVASAADFAREFQVSRETLARLNLYESLLRRWQPAVNLIAPATLEHIWGRHFADSAQLAGLIPTMARRLVDLGSGAGFPGLVLAILCGEAVANAGTTTARADHHTSEPSSTNIDGKGLNRVILVESDQRKAAFLREVARQTGAPVDILSIRIENPATQIRIGAVDVVTARALAPLDRLLALSAPLFGAETVGLFLKGRDAEAEIDAARSRWSFEVSLVPSVTEARANIVVISHLSPNLGGAALERDRQRRRNT